MTDLPLYAICLILGAAGAWIMARWGKALGLLDKPNGRSSHAMPTSKGGGIGILAAFIVVSSFLQMPSSCWVPAIFLALLSLWGDRFDLSPKIRLPLQFIAALFFVQFSAFSLQPSALLIFFLVVFIVATANWYNFMDGINGIAALTGIVGFGLLAVFNALSGGDSRFSVLSICIALSCLGFLPFNMPKAKVFMGDVGSILLGFVFAAIVILLSKSFFDFVCLAAFLFPFYADEILTMALRVKDGESLLKPHRRHLYQILANETGIDHWKVSVGYGILQAIVGLSILLARPFGILTILVLLIIFFSGFVWANYFIRTRMVRSF